METVLLYIAKGLYYLCLLIGSSILLGTVVALIFLGIFLAIINKDIKDSKNDRI